MMRLPRPASPRELWADIKAFASVRRPHQWIALSMALAIPTVIFLTFMVDFEDAGKTPPQLIYVDSWPADRSMEETKANIDAQEARRRKFEEDRQRSFQKIQDFNNKIGL